MFKNLIFSGGGVRCLTYIGVLRYFEEEHIKFKFKCIVGTSGGALFALIYILNYSYLDIKHLAINLDLNSLQDISSENLFNFFNKYGIDSGKKFEHFIELLLEKKIGKREITFKEFYELYKIKLIINGTCVNTSSIEYFSHETTPDMLINTAVRISCSIPLMFNSVKINDKIYVDGGIVDNYPIHLFKGDLDKTIGFYIKYNSQGSDDIVSIDKFILNILGAVNNKFESLLLCNYKKNTIIIESNIVTMDINISQNQILDTISDGYKFTKEYFDNYIIKNILNDIIDKL